MKRWMMKAVLLVLGCGMMLAGVKMLRDVQVRRNVETHGVDPDDGAKIYRQRMQDTDRLLDDREAPAVSWNR
jgi:hypothetical protein